MKEEPSLMTLRKLKGIIMKYYGQLYAIKLDNLDEMGEVLERYYY